MIQGERCEHCPVSPDRPCRGQMARRLCELVDPGHPDHNPAYGPALIRQAEAAAYPSVATMAGNLAGAIAGHASPAPAPDRPSAAESLAMVAAMKSCPFYSKGPGCGCSGAFCGLRKGATVSHRDCFACIERYG